MLNSPGSTSLAELNVLQSISGPFLDTTVSILITLLHWCTIQILMTISAMIHVMRLGMKRTNHTVNYRWWRVRLELV
ncbi:hypothetical protein IE53DRAFT_158073 [Violaceomyces palustris]|uniref:Uncharacterized protein n=1 Tax=Violaceomyces palustris TaxID=1673888 RepID=A0ACD0P8N0_9BASI|nr:hypothetical protein IE53DRAFT_158073 [Violaceomyces palustris]